jgi:hypothetical protein
MPHRERRSSRLQLSEQRRNIVIIRDKANIVAAYAAHFPEHLEHLASPNLHRPVAQNVILVDPIRGEPRRIDCRGLVNGDRVYLGEYELHFNWWWRCVQRSRLERCVWPGAGKHAAIVDPELAPLLTAA